MKKRGSTLGSSSSTEGPPIRIGRLGRPHGLDGFLGLYVEPDDIVYFEVGSVVEVAGAPHTVRAVRKVERGYQVAFEEALDRNAAERIRSSDVTVSHRRGALEGEFWPDDLIGLEVRPGGGRVVGLHHGPTQSRLEIERDGSRFEVPFVTELVPTVDLDSGFVEIVEIPGLIQP